MVVVGFYGYGNMGSSFAKGVAMSSDVDKIVIYTRSVPPSEMILNKMEVEDSPNGLQSCDVIFLAVKPDSLGTICEELTENKIKFGPSNLVVSMMLGVSIEKIKKCSPFKECTVARIMPNLAASVQASATALCARELNAKSLEMLKRLLSCCGTVTEVVSEQKLHTAVGIAGSALAYVFLFVDALAEGGVRAGMTRGSSEQLAVQTLKGAAELLLQSGEHPQVLKDRVCSPGGSTIAGVCSLHENGFTTAVHEAVQAAIDKSIEFSL